MVFFGYLVSFILYFINFESQKEALYIWATRVALFSLSFHFTFLLVTFLRTRFFLVTNLSEYIEMVSFLILVVSFVMETRAKARFLMLFSLPIVLIFCLFAIVLTEQKDWGLKERDEWKDRSEGVEQELSKFQNLQAALEKEKEALEKERERLAQEKEQAVSAGQHLEKSLEGLRREFSESESLRESLQKEIAELQAEKERPISELEKIKGELQGQIDSITKQARPLQSQLESLEKVLATLRGSKKTEPKEKGRGRHLDV